jgi:catechol 2,3-dioxygenase-like lactoylglutathione lyase family enzyme
MSFAFAVIHAVDDVEQAAAFFRDVLDFREHSRGSDWAQVENGALTVRLVAAHRFARAPSDLELDLATPDVPAASAALLERKGLEPLMAPTWVSAERMEARLRAPHRVVLTLSRTFDEDALGILPELPTRLVWTEDAVAYTQRLLRLVPVSFREQSRRRVIECAETLAITAGGVTVDRDTALRALVMSTPAFQHEGLRAALRGEGIDPEPLFAELTKP